MAENSQHIHVHVYVASKLARGFDILTSQGGDGRQETCIIQDTYTKCKWVCIAPRFLQQLVGLVAVGSGEVKHLDRFLQEREVLRKT